MRRITLKALLYLHVPLRDGFYEKHLTRYSRSQGLLVVPEEASSFLPCRSISVPRSSLRASSRPHWSHPFNLLREPLICTPRPLTSVPLLRYKEHDRAQKHARRWERGNGDSGAHFKTLFSAAAALLRDKIWSPDNLYQTSCDLAAQLQIWHRDFGFCFGTACWKNMLLYHL